MSHLFQIFKDLHFKKKMFLSYLFVTIIPILVLGIYSYNDAKNSMLKQSVEALDNAVGKMADNTSYKMERYNHIIQFIIYNTRIQQLFSSNYMDTLVLAEDLREYLNPLFNNIMDSNEYVRQITVFAKSNMPEYGQYIQSFNKIERKSWVTDIQYKTGIQWFYEDGALFAASRLIDLSSGKELGIVYLEVDAASILNEASSFITKEYGIVVFNQKRQPVLSVVNLNNPKEAIPFTSLIKIKHGITRFQKQEYIIVKAQVKAQDWSISCYVPADIITARSSTILSTTAVIAGICFVVLIGIIWIFSTTMVKRIEELNANMEKVENGNFKIDVHSKSKDEIGQLTNRFGNLVKKINHLIEEVYERQINQKEAELRALQAQINPHFLYNTLSAINWKAIEIEASEISNMVTLTSKFYRTALNKGKIVTLIRNEIENTRSYIEIQRIILDYGFDIVYNIDENVYPYHTLNLILQPVVENALEHGINEKRNGRGVLKVEAVLKDEYIEFVVEDNGVGMDKDKLNSVLEQQSKGYGLKNVHERIKLFFGEEYGISVFSELNRGTMVQIRIPKYIHKE